MSLLAVRRIGPSYRFGRFRSNSQTSEGLAEVDPQRSHAAAANPLKQLHVQLQVVPALWLLRPPR
jgi:hypothetical protein